MHEKAELLTKLIADFPTLDHVFNPLSDHDIEHDVDEQAPKIRRAQFQSYLNSRINNAQIVIVGESMTYQDAKFTGIPMHDEPLLLGRKLSAPFDYRSILDVQPTPTSNPKLGFSHSRYGDYAATVLYNFLYKHNINPLHVMTWDAFPFHTHNAGDRLSNRPARQYEVEAVHNIHREFFGLFSGCKMITLSNTAHAVLNELGIDNEFIAHPVAGCAKAFTESLAKYLLPEVQPA